MWIKYRTGIDSDGAPIEITDPGAASSLQSLAIEAVAAKDVASTRAFVSAALGKAMSESDEFVGGVASALTSLEKDGPRAALKSFLAAR